MEATQTTSSRFILDTNSVTLHIFVVIPFLVAPIFEKKSFRVFLTLTISKSALSFGPGYQVVSRQINFQVFPYRATYLCFWTPSATIFLLSYPTNISIILFNGIFLESHGELISTFRFSFQMNLPRVLRADRFRFVARRSGDRIVWNLALFHTKRETTLSCNRSTFISYNSLSSISTIFPRLFPYRKCWLNYFHEQLRPEAFPM